ncbi:MAG: nucleoside kinase [Lachnospiraceae bacterium]|nr:nucleoside kinase [Lachnospiraceae bacterium]
MQEDRKLTITLGEKSLQVSYGTTLQTLVKEQFPQDYRRFYLAEYNGKLTELHKKIKRDGKVRFLDAKNKDSQRAYRRSLVFMMQRAAKELLEKEDCEVRVRFSLGDGYYCTIEDESGVSEGFLTALGEKMDELIAKDLPIEKHIYPTCDAMSMFAEQGMKDKERLLRYRSNSGTNIYELDGAYDYFYGYMVPSTGYLKVYDLKPLDRGFMLLFPGKDPEKVEEYKPAVKLFDTLVTAKQWGSRMEVNTVGALNDAIAAGRIKEIILMQEAFMEDRIGALAEQIASESDCKFVMIAGPSSSGKTTFSHRLSIQLKARGLSPHPVALDNYYLDRDKMPLDEFGEKDFEALEGLDIARFNEDMGRLLKGEKVELPVFNFNIGKRDDKTIPMQLGKEDVLVIEGIHGLNDKLSYTLPKESKYKIYISALTQLAIDEHNPLSTTDGRLIRRIVRDARTRNTSARETIAMWDSVRRGEEKNIFPFQEEADAMFNSALIYEMSVLKLYAQPQLYAIPSDAPEFKEAKRLIKLLDYFMPVPTEDITNSSLIREFIGGSCFRV